MYAEEEFHRGGQCCEKISYPLDIGLQSYFGMDLTQKMDSCNKFLRDSVLKKVPDVMASNIVEMVSKIEFTEDEFRKILQKSHNRSVVPRQ